MNNVAAQSQPSFEAASLINVGEHVWSAAVEGAGNLLNGAIEFAGGLLDKMTGFASRAVGGSVESLRSLGPASPMVAMAASAPELRPASTPQKAREPDIAPPQRLVQQAREAFASSGLQANDISFGELGEFTPPQFYAEGLALVQSRSPSVGLGRSV